jgi:hypothetical protein
MVSGFCPDFLKKRTALAVRSALRIPCLHREHAA